jgi:mRNA interferase YafQ
MMRVIQPSSFRKDVKKQMKRGKDLGKLKAIVEILIAGETLPERCVDHSLAGSWVGWRDCHIEPDWILIYKISPDILTLGRTGSHSELF